MEWLAGDMIRVGQLASMQIRVDHFSPHAGRTLVGVVVLSCLQRLLGRRPPTVRLKPRRPVRRCCREKGPQ